MSVNYSCNQFEKAYKPTRLGNWEVPKWHLNRPKGRSTVTKVIVNDRGHLLPGVQKTDQKHWAGLYLGTYQLPKRITKDIVQELIAPKCQSYMKRSYHQPILESKSKAENKTCNNRLKGLNASEQRTINNDQEEDKESIKTVKTTISNSSKTTSVSNCSSGRGRRNPSEQQLFNSTLPEHVTTPSRAHSSPALSRISGDENKHHEHHGRSNKHHRLPDTIEDAVYRSLQMKRDKHPGLGLDGFWPKCSAVAYKSFNDPGPTQCSKLRVYRPKTSKDGGGNGRQETAGNGRPKTCGSLQALTDIKLALCWDLDAPFDGRRSADKPAVFQKIVKKDSAEMHSGKPVPRAPNSSAVMGFVRPADEPESPRVSRPRNLSAIVNLIPEKLARNNDESGGDREEPDPAKSPPASREKIPEEVGNVDDKPEQSDRANAFGACEKQHCRPCVACDYRRYYPAAAKRCQKSHEEKNPYKMAFKAGVPVTSPVKHGRTKCKKKLKVPKPKTTNSDKKKYVIGTLLPPFSMWPGTTARDYPEHWRLTSVYRQAFKPLESRKQSFLDTIYL
ncbi:uncharacterized protein LOC126846461 [Adelges cooleyi]|uniref:uncharacterized protein LOC126846461 n=1 Tax=Adelges cooleyi TaxID=133065 RepID=UPI00217FD355|nr:uncharacterized protein LOC126846461 [Adelges cooleyi]